MAALLAQQAVIIIAGSNLTLGSTGNPAAEGTGYFFTQNCKFQLFYSFMVEKVC